MGHKTEVKQFPIEYRENSKSILAWLYFRYVIGSKKNSATFSTNQMQN